MKKLELQNVNFSYNRRARPALYDFSVTLDGGVYGLLGANGAGKTTLISLIVGLRRPDSGRIAFGGRTPAEWGNAYFDHIGYLPQAPRFYDNYTIWEFLLYMARLKGMSPARARARSEELLTFVNLADERKKTVGACSGGMRQRLGIAQAMLNDPDLLILDEPTAGLDPLERVRFRNLISRLGEERTVLLATHIVPDVEYIAKDILLLKGGRLLREGTVEQLTEPLQNAVWEFTVADEAEVSRVMAQSLVSNVRQLPGGFLLRVVSEQAPAPEAAAVRPTLEDVYLREFGEVTL